MNGATPTNLSTDSSPNTSTLSQQSTPPHPTLTNGPTSVDEKGDRARTSQGSVGVRRPKTAEKTGQVTSRTTTKPGDKAPGRGPGSTSTPGKSGLPTSRRTNLNQVTIDNSESAVDQRMRNKGICTIPHEMVTNI